MPRAYAWNLVLAAYRGQLVPADGWAWSWLGKACEAMGDLDEARNTYEQETELDGAGTAAPELLANLIRKHPR